MNPIEINSKWYIQVHTEEFGEVLQLDNDIHIKPIEFQTKQEAIEYIEGYVLN